LVSSERWYWKLGSMLLSATPSTRSISCTRFSCSTREREKEEEEEEEEEGGGEWVLRG